MEEEFLAYLWRYRLINQPFFTIKGQNIEVLHPGERNVDAGPDFFNARIRIGETIWAGNVEIHVNSSDWYKHGHQEDESYRNTILHVVYQDDIEGSIREIPGIPVFEIKNHFSESIYLQYRNFMSNKLWIPCAGQLRDVDRFTTTSWLENLTIERLENKSSRLGQALERNINNWEQTFYEFIARSFGARVNADAFERLARSLPLNVLAREKKDIFHLETLLFGQAGMLDDEATDDYHLRLKAEFRMLRKKYQLKPLPQGSFKYLRLRPPNFPTLRIAQFAVLIYRSTALFSRVMESQSAEELFAMFRVECLDYWENHYRFGKVSTPCTKKLGEESVNLILVNTVLPFMFVYGKERGSTSLCDRALSILDRLPPEENSIIKKWRTIGISASNALESQALLELKDRYCNHKLCLECRIGHKLFSV